MCLSTPYSRKQKGKSEYNADCTRGLKGHPLPCAQEDSGCLNTLRMLRAAAPHYPHLCKLLQHVYEAIRLHRFINDIDVALCNGDFKQLCLLLGSSNYAEFWVLAMTVLTTTLPKALVKLRLFSISSLTYLM